MSPTFSHWGPWANRRRLVRLFEITLADPDSRTVGVFAQAAQAAGAGRR